MADRRSRLIGWAIVVGLAALTANADTIQTTSFLLTQEFQDNQAAGSITPLRARDMIVSLAQRQIVVALSDEVTNLAVVTNVFTIRVPEAITLSNVTLSSNTAPAGTGIIVDIKYNGISIFSTKPQIAAGNTTSVGTAQPVLSTTALAYDGVLQFSITQVGSTTAGTGLKVTLLGQRT